MASSKDVAKLANVSVSTVSRAFREEVYINEVTKIKVFKAARELGYTPNLVARSLRNQKSKVIGLIISDIDNIFYSIVTRIIESNLKKAGYRLLLTYSNESSEQELENLNLLSSSQCEGIIFTPTSTKNQATISRLKKQGTALVQMYRVGFEDIDSVMVDNQKGAYSATKHLINSGHSNILLLTVKNSIPFSSKNNKPIDLRSEGYKQALLEENLPVLDSNIVFLPYHTDLRGLISQKLRETKPTAVIAGTNLIAMDLVKSCKEMKLSIPNDISLVMFDDVDWASLYGITTIAQPITEIAQATCSAILEQIENRKTSNTTFFSNFEPVLISRNSVKNLYIP